MAANKFSDGMGYKHTEDNGLPVHTISSSLFVPHIKRLNRMAQIKWAILVCDMLGIPVFLLGVVKDFGSFNSTVLLMISLFYAIPRCYFDIIARRQRTREKDLELWHKEQDKIERINKNKNSL